jgi:hypothetical protein
MSLLTTPETWPFGVALVLLVALCIAEGVGLLLAASPSTLIDGWLPDMDGTEGALAWLHLGRVPTLVVLGLFLMGFALAGYVIQALLHRVTGGYGSAWLVSVPAVLAGLSTTRLLAGLLSQVIPREETVAVSEQTLIGRVAAVTQGVARAWRRKQKSKTNMAVCITFWLSRMLRMKCSKRVAKCYW